MKNVNEVIEMIESLEKVYMGSKNKVGIARYLQLTKIKGFIKANGFPHSNEDRFKCSIVPLVFQEANYDDLDRTKQGADLRHLQQDFDLDFIIQNNGQEQKEVSEIEFKGYVKRSHEAIDYWKQMAKD